MLGPGFYLYGSDCGRGQLSPLNAALALEDGTKWCVNAETELSVENGQEEERGESRWAH